MAVFYRICQKRHAATAMDGEGARLYGGRWNPPGVAMVYLADSRALAVLEILVHASRDAMSLDWLLWEVEIPDKWITTLGVGDLPRGWDRQPGSLEARGIGRKWVSEAKSPALRVPSAIIPEESTVLLNPMHEKISKVRVSESRAFSFDPRLKG